MAARSTFVHVFDKESLLEIFVLRLGICKDKHGPMKPFITPPFLPIMPAWDSDYYERVLHARHAA